MASTTLARTQPQRAMDRDPGHALATALAA
jgi:hypothetical protein